MIWSVFLQKQALINESNQANRAISTGKLHALLHFHTQPINVVVFHDSQGKTSFEGGFPLRCLQRLSRPYLATLHLALFATFLFLGQASGVWLAARIVDAAGAPPVFLCAALGLAALAAAFRHFLSGGGGT
jgi:hypothetical protein